MSDDRPWFHPRWLPAHWAPKPLWLISGVSVVLALFVLVVGLVRSAGR